MLHRIANFKCNLKFKGSILYSSHQAHYNLHDRYVAIPAHMHTTAEEVMLEPPHGNTRASQNLGHQFHVLQVHSF